MLDFMKDKKAVVKRYVTTLGEYNRPIKTLETVGSFLCHVSQDDSSTTQKAPQKENTTGLNLFCDPDEEIQTGDIVYIYELDEYDEPIEETEFKAIADKPYKKRTHLEVELLSYSEV